MRKILFIILICGFFFTSCNRDKNVRAVLNLPLGSTEQKMYSCVDSLFKSRDLRVKKTTIWIIDSQYLDTRSKNILVTDIFNVQNSYNSQVLGALNLQTTLATNLVNEIIVLFCLERQKNPDQLFPCVDLNIAAQLEYLFENKYGKVDYVDYFGEVPGLLELSLLTYNKSIRMKCRKWNDGDVEITFVQGQVDSTSIFNPKTGDIYSLDNYDLSKYAGFEYGYKGIFVIYKLNDARLKLIESKTKNF